MKITFKGSSSGLIRASFKDGADNKCSLSESSAIDQPTIYLGVDDADPQIMNADALRLRLPASGANGWTSYYIPKEVSLTTKMRLTQEMVRELLGPLTYFAEHGKLMPEHASDELVVKTLVKNLPYHDAYDLAIYKLSLKYELSLNAVKGIDYGCLDFDDEIKKVIANEIFPFKEVPTSNLVYLARHLQHFRTIGMSNLTRELILQAVKDHVIDVIDFDYMAGECMEEIHYFNTAVQAIENGI